MGRTQITGLICVLVAVSCVVTLSVIFVFSDPEPIESSAPVENTGAETLRNSVPNNTDQDRTF